MALTQAGFPLDKEIAYGMWEWGTRKGAFILRGDKTRRSWKLNGPIFLGSKGLPKALAFYTVKRQAMATDSHEPVGVYLGTTGGEIWASRDEGTAWTCLARHLPEVYSIEVAE